MEENYEDVDITGNIYPDTPEEFWFMSETGINPDRPIPEIHLLAAQAEKMFIYRLVEVKEYHKEVT